jgi:hypothetical protein
MKGEWLKKGCLIGVLALFGFCACMAFIALIAGWEPGRTGDAGYLAFFGAPALGSWILLGRMRNKERLEEQRKACKPNLDRWEREGYDVSDFKGKWFE